VSRASAARPPPGRNRPRASRERQRQRLIDACISALHVHGPSNTTVEKVVAIARMSPGIVRFYFDSKAAMLVASLEYLAAEFEDRLLVPVGALRSDPVAALERLVDLYLAPEIASARKVSVWYSFWGEASSRQEYFDICGQRDARFEALVRELIGRLIELSNAAHLDADAIALGLIGVLEMLWQGFAFQTESTIDRAAARRRGMAYLSSVFPTLFPAARGAPALATLPASAYASATLLEAERERLFRGSWQFAGLEHEFANRGDYLCVDAPGTRALLVRQPAGTIRAFVNACPQRPHALAMERSGHLAEIECRMHGLRYSLDGEPLAATPGGTLAELEVATVAGLVFARARTGAAPALPQPAAAASRPLGLPTLRSLEVPADWKLIVEHWLEEPTAAAGAASGSVELGSAIPPASSWSGARYRALAGPERGAGVRSFIAPNLLLETRPDALLVSIVLPLAVGRCRLSSLVYARAAGERRARALGYLSARLAARALAAEAALAASVQRGLESPGGAPIGPVPPPLAGFRHMIGRLLPGALRPPGDTP
jgi:TetR/AcrR family transcriptional repressor of bet genes